MIYPAQSDLPSDAGSAATFLIANSAMAVRDGLRAILQHPVMMQQSEDLRSSVEVVLAEALNNIVEHAYACADGQIELHLRLASGGVDCDIFDSGSPMPNDELPEGLAQSTADDQELPEGGFGWFLIRTLTSNLAYRRIDARNHLSFQLNIEQ
jgi:serine/threonine-protein kinase RsbW